MSNPKTLQVTNVAGEVIATYPDFEPGQPVRVGPDRQGANVAGADDGYVFRGPSRHPQYAVIEDTRLNTTLEVERDRLSPAPTPPGHHPQETP